MQVFGHLGKNTFYYSSADFQEDLVVSVRLYKDDTLLMQSDLSVFVSGVYQFEYTFNAVGKYLALLSQDGCKPLLCTIMVMDLNPPRHGGVELPGLSIRS